MPKSHLLDAALAVLAREGPPRPEDIAQEAGVSKALVYHHFRTVRGLHDAMAERILRETQEGLDALAREYPNPRERLETLARALLAEPPEPPAATRNVLRFWLDAERGGLRDALVADFVAKTLKEARSHADPTRVASFLLSRWHGATLVYANGTPIDFDAEAERTVADLERML